ncbi:MAG TPA: hypothetical protein C5S37_14245 [Methanophagales archaeon]|nr:hypothetical protein [Methanophagales archaeon]
MSNIYGNILEVLQDIEKEKRNREHFLNSIPSTRADLYRSVIFPNTRKFIPVEAPDGTIRLIPGNQNLYLFRGQPEDDSPCLSKIYRNNPNEIDIFIARLKQIEFELVLREHPAIQDIQKDGIHISFTGLAQHYELATDYLDVTSDPYIAAFFAVCTYCKSEQRYIPVSSQNGPSVLMKTPALVYTNPVTEPKLEIVGLQPFPRPGNQKAYAVKLRKGENFSAQKMLFHHSKESSQKIYDLFDGGKKLFPPDPIKNKAQEISEGVVFSQEAFEQVLQRYDFARRAEYYLNGLREMENKIKISNTCEYRFSITEINQFKGEWENGGKSDFYNQIGPTRLTYL